jgi:hypothetical protein
VDVRALLWVGWPQIRFKLYPYWRVVRTNLPILGNFFAFGVSAPAIYEIFGRFRTMEMGASRAPLSLRSGCFLKAVVLYTQSTQFSSLAGTRFSRAERMLDSNRRRARATGSPHGLAYAKRAPVLYDNAQEGSISARRATMGCFSNKMYRNVLLQYSSTCSFWRSQSTPGQFLKLFGVPLNAIIFTANYAPVRYLVPRCWEARLGLSGLSRVFVTIDHQ